MPDPVHALSRRQVLGSAVAGATLFCGASRLRAQPASPPTRKVISPAALKAAIRGPILAVPTSFTREDRVDSAGVDNMIRRGLDAGIVAFELTAGDSQFHVLSYDEIKQLTRTLVEAAGGKGTAIAATNAWWTARAIDYAKFAESVGADGVQVLVPQGNEETLVEHYQRIADSTSLGMVLHGKFSTALLERLARIDSIVGIKEDVTEKYMVDLQTRFGQRFAVFGGGQKWRFMVGQFYGMNGYLSTFATFEPRIAVRFWNAVQQNDLAAAREIVVKYDNPLFDFCLSQPKPFHAQWRGILELFGVAQRYLRRPEASLDEEEMKKLRDFLQGMGLEPSRGTR